MLKTRRRKNIFYAIISLLFTLVLFFNANGSTLQGNIIPTPTSYEETLKEIAIQPQYDSSKYFIQGFTPSVTVKLKSDNRVQLNTELNAETRNFRVIADLDGLEPGTHEVPLKVQNLSSSVSATLETKSITVTIEKKVTKIFDVQTDLSQGNLQEGYKLGKIAIEPSTVSVTTGEETLKEITQVLAPTSAVKNATKDIATTVTVAAVDANGQKLPAIITPEQVKVSAPVTLPSKQVPVTVVPTGKMATSLATIDYELNEYNVTVSAEQAVLDQLDQVSVSVDIDNVVKQTEVTTAVEVPEGVQVSPNEVTVTIKPVQKTTTSATSSSRSQTQQTTRSSTVSSESLETTESATSEASLPTSTTVEEPTSETTN